MNAVSDKEKYDASVKKIVSQPRFVAAIMRLTVPEYEGMTVEEILPYIVEISDETAVDDVSAASLQNLPQEQVSLLSKIISYDLHIKAKNPKAGNINVTLYFDFEFQNEYRDSSLGYPLLKRAFYYVARELDSQLGVLTKDTDYGSLQKSYSIWICNEHIPRDEQNSMTRYHIIKEDVIGKSRDIPEYYDLMEVIMIRRGSIEIDEEIFDFLNGLFKSDVDRVVKYTGGDKVIEGEVKKMGGFGQALVDKTEEKAREEGRAEGKAEGKAEGRAEGLKDTAVLMSYLVQNGRSDDIIKAANDPAYLDQLLDEYEKANQVNTLNVVNKQS